MIINIEPNGAVNLYFPPDLLTEMITLRLGLALIDLI